jgi:hypothetical protein
MPAFAVKHLVSEHGPLMANLKDIRRTPYSFTSKHTEASAAARGALVYVVETHRLKGETSYKLGYVYRAFEAYKRAGSVLWKNEFIYKNSAVPGDPAEGAYFETAVDIRDPDFCAGFLALPPGMVEIPPHLVAPLDALIDDPANGAKAYR